VFKPEDLDEQEEQELASHCDEVFSVPVRSEALQQAIVSNLSLGDGYGELLRQGIELEWKRTSEDQCGQCEESGSGGRCAYSQKREFLGCLCSGGKAGNPFCKPSSKVLNRASLIFFHFLQSTREHASVASVSCNLVASPAVSPVCEYRAAPACLLLTPNGECFMLDMI
jgi:hypothetical protein